MLHHPGAQRRILRSFASTGYRRTVALGQVSASRGRDAKTASRQTETPASSRSGQGDLWSTDAPPHRGCLQKPPLRFAIRRNASAVPCAPPARSHGKPATEFQPTEPDCLPTHPRSGRTTRIRVRHSTCACLRVAASRSSDFPLVRLRRQARCPNRNSAIHVTTAQAQQNQA
ncbi:MAG: hypothetical protein JWN06_2393 [Propionibacteriaceae bacterium]|jgi:hypothetical protein|nr:hypothetical protein [Propionibacteriaceae bacterium]